MLNRPEVLAPAGDFDSLHAALATGADAIYFGLDEGFNARARATNFALNNLADVVHTIHRAGARAYVTLNTLVFESELATVGALLEACADAGVDAIIVQDPAVALLARQLCPTLHVHASTQMTVSSGAAANLLRPLGLRRVVVPRELSLEEIATYRATTDLPLEVFIHGALCVSWSGQCLTSESWGGRSANRGQCAQSCRLPYELMVDDTQVPLGDVAYLLSPLDLVGTHAVPRLAELGIASLKIEGRLKGPAYVASAVTHYRHALGLPALSMAPTEADATTMALAYSRGQSPGFLDGVNHQRLVEGRFGRHRGVPAGVVTRVEAPWVYLEPAPMQRPVTGGRAMTASQPVPTPRTEAAAALELAAGQGVVFDRGRPDEPEEGGPIFAVQPWRRPGQHGVALQFGQPGPDLAKVRPGDYVWVTSAPQVTKLGTRVAALGQGELGRLPVTLAVTGELGAPLKVQASVEFAGAKHVVHAQSVSTLTPATGEGLASPLLQSKLATFGGSAFGLAALDLSGLPAKLHLPVSELKPLRRAIVAALDAACAPIRHARVQSVEAALHNLRPVTPSASASEPQALAHLVPLCRTDAQLDALLELPASAGVTEIELDWMELVGLGKAVARARAAGKRVIIAGTRIQKPGEEKIDAHLLKLAPDGMLIRSWGTLAYVAAQRQAGDPVAQALTLHGDYALNIANAITAQWVQGHGLATVTCAHDLDAIQVQALAAHMPAGALALTLHHHIPTFHTEHCIYAHLLSTGTDFRTCGRPCEQHRIALRDRMGMVHPVMVDIGCRNTVFNAQAQTAADLMGQLPAIGRWRIEFVRESADVTRRVWLAYQQLRNGDAAAKQVLAELSTVEQYGVTKGTMRTLQVLR